MCSPPPPPTLTPQNPACACRSLNPQRLPLPCPSPTRVPPTLAPLCTCWAGSPPHPQDLWPLPRVHGDRRDGGAALLTLMCILARFRRLSVVWRVLSGPRGTSCLSCSR